MDSHVLRRIGFELATQLFGARVETVYRPNSSVFVFKISKPALRPYLIFQSGREAACILASFKKPDSPPSPDAPTMRLRKYLCGKKINGIWLDWDKNTLIIGFAPRKFQPVPGKPDDMASPDQQTEDGSLFLYLNLKLGPHLAGERPGFAENLINSPVPRWKINEALESLNCPEGDISKPWNEFPYLTPLLRKTIPLFDDKGEQLALLADLESGHGDTFVYAPNNDSLPLLSAWSLPPSLRPPNSKEQVFESTLEGLEECACSRLFTHITATKTKSERQDLIREKKRISRAFVKLEQEEKRLHELIELKEKAIFIQAQLYCLDKDAKLTKVNLTASNGEQTTILLDKQKTVQENMELMFKKAARAVRGLPHIERRRAELKKLLERLENMPPELAPSNLQTVPNDAYAKNKRKAPFQPDSSSQVAQYLSPSGLVVLRGKNAKGNRQALKMASPYDIWLHAEGGPSAHAILKLPHAAFHIPEEDLEMAARLVAEKSWQRNERRATIICALARDVHPVKGAPHGTVRVDKIFRTIIATITNG